MASRKENTQRLAKLMEKIDIAMFTTVAKDGSLVSRPLSTQAAEFDGERVWFFTAADSPKVAEIRRHPKVNVAYASRDRNTYISAAGDARVHRDQARIDRYWNDALKAFFPEGRKDPNLALIEVRVRTVEYWDGPGSWLGKAITFVVARVTGNDDVMAENRIVDLATGRSRTPPSSDSRAGRRAVAAGASTARKRVPRKNASSATTPTKAAPRKRPSGKAAPRKATRATPTKRTAPRKPVRPAGTTKAAKRASVRKPR